MFRLLKRKAGPVVPILYVDANVNQANTENLIKKLRRFKYNYAKGIAVVCSVQNCMPVQVDKIYEQIARIKQQHKIPVYSFLLDECTPESYYMASGADEVYSLPSTIFQLERNENKINWDGFLEQNRLRRFVVKSSENLSGVSLDQYTSANTSHIGNKKDSHISQKIYAQAIQQRLSNINSKDSQKFNTFNSIIPKSIPNQMIGEQAVNLGLVDHVGQHYDVLRLKHPDCHFEVIKYIQEPKSIKKALAILTSPILLALFILKVIIKWSLIMYVWLKSKNSEKPKTIEEAKDEVEKSQH